MSTRSVIVATHGHCFDGMASAVVFTRLFRALEPTNDPSFTYRACDYGPHWNGVPEDWLTGDENAILDYRYTAVPKLTWYFDHHRTAFNTEHDRDHFEIQNGKTRFHDADYSSCTKLIVDIARERFGLTFPELDGLVAWADKIDAARFSDPAIILARSEPALQLMTVLFHHGDDRFLAQIVPQLLVTELDEVARSQQVQSLYAPLGERHNLSVERMRAAARLHGEVGICDLSEAPIDAVEKFAMYAFFPTALYSVILSRTDSQLRISIGFNPWAGKERGHDISAICKRHGGGGHPVVGAFSLPPTELERARGLMNEVVEELNR
ncbi:MAG: hypothetical protein U0165_00835 [Polyangiaceae bacterium]